MIDERFDIVFPIKDERERAKRAVKEAKSALCAEFGENIPMIAACLKILTEELYTRRI